MGTSGRRVTDAIATVNVPCTVIVNGQPHEIDVAPDETLLEALRSRLGLTGTKDGCSEGECGACTVLVDGEPVDSCLLPVLTVAGRAVTTIEGVADADGTLSRVQDAIARAGADPVRVLHTRLRDVDHRAPRIRAGTKPRRRADRDRGEPLPLHRVSADRRRRRGCRGQRVMSVVGSPMMRTDARDKVTGRAIYGVDVEVPGTLTAVVLRSPVAAGRIRRLDLDAVRRAPGVRAVIAAADVPDDPPRPRDQGPAAVRR